MEPISTMIPNNINKVARADHRSSDSRVWFGSLFVWPKAVGPYAKTIRRARLIAFLLMIISCLFLLIWSIDRHVWPPTFSDGITYLLRFTRRPRSRCGEYPLRVAPYSFKSLPFQPVESVRQPRHAASVHPH